MFEQDDTTRRNKSTGQRKKDNRGPITGAPGAHPIGTGAGAAAGGAAGIAGGAAIGAATGTAAGGPIGTAVGAVAGAVAGGLGGKAVAEHINPTQEDAYWREQHSRQSYYDKNYSYDDYEGAYRTGYEGYGRFCGSGKSYEECESELQRNYQEKYPNARLSWDKARPAVRAAWERYDRHLERYIDYDVVDQNDKKIGTLECLWSDHLGEPAFIGVRTGWFLGKTHVVPAHSVQVSESGKKIRLPYAEEKVKDAPSYDADAEMTEEKGAEVYRYYGVQGTGETQQGTVSAREDTRSTQATPEQATIQLSEEELKVGKRQVEVGGVRLRKVVRTEVVNQPVELQREEIVIERVPASEAHSGRQRAFNEQEVYIPLRREEAVVQKETRLREEVRARKRTETEQRQVSEPVRREDVEVQKEGEARERGGRPRTPAETLREMEEKPRSMRRHKGS